MNRKPFDEIVRKTLPFSRRWIAGGTLGAALAGTLGLLAQDEADAGKKGKKGKEKKDEEEERNGGTECEREEPHGRTAPLPPACPGRPHAQRPTSGTRRRPSTQRQRGGGRGRSPNGGGGRTTPRGPCANTR